MGGPSDLKLLQGEAKKIVRSARELCDSPHGIRRDPLCTDRLSSLRLAHYTSLEAIVSMLQTSDVGLRLSDSSTMSDPWEGRATSDGRAIYRLLEDEFGRESWVWKRYSSAHICCLVGIDQTEHKGPVAGDELLFWRLYGNECRGVSIGMPLHLSKSLVESSVVQKVIYTDERRMEVNLAAISRLLEDLESLRSRACEGGVWSEIVSIVIPECDLLLGQRFLLKRSYYEMEREYRALAFVTQEDDNAPEDRRYSCRGLHVQHSRIRAYIQLPELSSASIFTTGSQITIGNNVPDAPDAEDTVTSLLKGLGIAPNVVKVGVSQVEWRPRGYFAG